jgi:deoxyribonuclease V
MDFKKATRLQDRMASRIRLSWTGGEIRRVAGADVACRQGDNRAAAAVVVLSFPGLALLETLVVRGRLSMPYIPGFLCFREGPLLSRAIRRLRVQPDVTLLDGNGIAHPRHLGLASYIGVRLDIPTIGCAKSAFFPFRQPIAERGGWTAYCTREGEKVGCCLRTKNGVKPVFVSAGHRIDGSLSRDIVLACSTFRLPQPLRLAHLAARGALEA